MNAHANHIANQIAKHLGLTLTETQTGGGCTALAGITESGHEVLITSEAMTPDADDDGVTIGIYNRETGDAEFWTESPNLVEVIVTATTEALKRLADGDYTPEGVYSV